MNEIELSKDSDAVILTTSRKLAFPGQLSHGYVCPKKKGHGYVVGCQL